MRGIVLEQRVKSIHHPKALQRRPQERDGLDSMCDDLYAGHGYHRMDFPIYTPPPPPPPPMDVGGVTFVVMPATLRLEARGMWPRRNCCCASSGAVAR